MIEIVGRVPEDIQVHPDVGSTDRVGLCCKLKAPSRNTQRNASTFIPQTACHNCCSQFRYARVRYYARVCGQRRQHNHQHLSLICIMILFDNTVLLVIFLRKSKLCYRVVLLVVFVFKVFPREHFKNKQ